MDEDEYDGEMVGLGGEEAVGLSRTVATVGKRICGGAGSSLCARGKWLY